MDDFLMEEKIIAAKQLPDGWEWHCHEGGTGELTAPDGKTYIKYDQISNESEWRKYAKNAEQVIKEDLEKGRVGDIDQQRVEDLLEGYAFIGIEQSTLDYILQNWDWQNRLDLSGKAYFGLRFSGDLKNVDLSNARMNECVFYEVKLISADLSGTDLQDTRFELGYLKDVNFAGCNMAGAEFRHTRISGQTYVLNEREMEHAKQMEPLIRQNFEECMRNGEDKPPKDDYSMHSTVRRPHKSR